MKRRPRDARCEQRQTRPARVLYDGVRQVAARLQVGIALLHPGACVSPSPARSANTMTAKDAVELCRLVQRRTIIPIRYEGWKHFQEGREAIEREYANSPVDVRERIRWLPTGVGDRARSMSRPGKAKRKKQF